MVLRRVFTMLFKTPFLEKRFFKIKIKISKNKRNQDIETFLKIDVYVTATTTNVSTVIDSKQHLTAMPIARIARSTYLSPFLVEETMLWGYNSVQEKYRRRGSLRYKIRCVSVRARASITRWAAASWKKITIERTIERSRALRFSCRWYKKREIYVT